MLKTEDLLNQLLQAALKAAQPEEQLARLKLEPVKGKTLVLGAGKASAAMAQALEKIWPDPLTGLVVTRYGYAVPCEQIEIIEAAHPVPDENSQLAAQRLLAMTQTLTADDRVLLLISGGGSSLLSLAADPLSFAEKQALNQALLHSGASISEINCVRRHLSAIKGGRLAAACQPAQVINLLISDVPGDNPLDIASGPGVPDPTHCGDALRILERYQIKIPDSLRRALEDGQLESIKPEAFPPGQIQTHLLAAPRQSLLAAAKVAEKQGITTHILGDALEGESREVAKVMAGIIQSCRLHQQPFKTPCLLLSGGETTVTLKGKGSGGPNAEFMLALAIALKGQEGVYALAVDTDGVDGAEEIAGAWISPETLDKARELGINPEAYLDNNDAHHFFQQLDQAVITGPTLTNVNDFRALLLL